MNCINRFTRCIPGHCLVLFGLVGALLTGCQKVKASGGHGHGHGGHGSAGHGSAEEHGHDEFDEVRLGWSDDAELFVEFETLVQGETSQFAPHISLLKDYSPVSDGEFAIVLTSKDAEGERYKTRHLLQDGIFELSITPEHAGQRQVYGIYRSGDRTERFNLGSVMVHADASEVPEESKESQTGIEFSKEQQWTVPFSTGAVEKRSIHQTVLAQGYVRSAPNAAMTVSAPFSGRILRGEVLELGDEVSSGEAVSVIAPTVDANVLPTLRAELAEAKNSLEQKRREVERLASLVDDGAIPKKRLLDARSELKSIEARVEAASSRIAQFEGFQTGSGAGALTLRAPISGKIVEKHVSTGQYVEQGEPIARIVDDSRLRLEARVSQSNLSNIQTVTGANLSQGETSLTLTDKHKIVSLNILDERTRTASTWFSLSGTNAEGLTPGAYHRVEIWAGPAEERLTVPKSAVIETKGLSVVYVVEDGERFRRQLVETGIEDGRWIEIKRGLEPDQRVATKGAYYLMLAASTSGAVGHHSH